ncbi:MAG TPA: hypothetical protein VEK15_08105, partial [Vicinamibacteria bacterium]|nr:hypothetical protein [Vicinamibacteria bacterium]
PGSAFAALRAGLAPLAQGALSLSSPCSWLMPWRDLRSNVRPGSAFAALRAGLAPLAQGVLSD